MPRKTNAETVAKKTTRPRKTTTTKRTRTRTAASAAKTVERAPILPCTETQVRERAYYIYLERREASGDAIADWLQAKRELTQSASAARD
jgi:hypothetical protein